MLANPTLGFVLHDVARLLRKRFEQRARQSHLTRAQWQTLSKLSVHEGINQNGLADLLEIEPITLVRLLDRMEERGWVERRRDPTDRRAWCLYLAPKTVPLLKIMRGVADVTRNEALAGIAEPERERLFDTLSVMRENLIAACATPVEEEEVING